MGHSFLHCNRHLTAHKRKIKQENKKSLLMDKIIPRDYEMAVKMLSNFVQNERIPLPINSKKI